MKSVVERIKVLVELRDSGSITNEEFDRMLELLEAEIDKEKLDSASENKTHNNKTLFQFTKKQVAGLTFSFLCLVILSYFTMIPAFIWDKDGDGFHTYRNDNCPEELGKSCNGCPDADNDQIADKDDYCKTSKGLASANGCPDSDGDGIKDADDQCLTEFGTTGCKGCPDSDGDIVTDSLDNCPNEKGLKQYNGCLQDPSSLARAKDKAALEAGNAVRVLGDIGNYKVANKWLIFKDGHYEYSVYEKKKYKAVETQEMVEILNQYYGLQGTLKKTDIVTQPPGPKPTSGGLTQAEQARLNELYYIKDRPLTRDEYLEKKQLEAKKKL